MKTTVKKRWLLILMFVLVCVLSAFGIVATKTVNTLAEQSTFYMREGASVRKGTKKGIRFSTYVMNSYLESLEGREYTFGTLIIPASVLGENPLDETWIKADGSGALNIEQTVWGENDGTKTFFHAVCAEIPDDAYLVDLVGRSYIKIGTKYTFAAEAQIRNVAEVAAAALNDGESDIDNSLLDYVSGVAKSVEIDETANVYLGDALTLTAKTDPADMAVVWSSDNKDVATVDKNGAVTGVAEGVANITAKFGNITATCAVTVSNKIGIDKTNVVVNAGKTVTLTAATVPAGEEVVWSTNNSSVATVTDGVVSGIAEGTANITATCGKYSVTGKVTVVSEERATVLTAKEQLEALNGQDVTGNFILGNDIDLGGVTGTDAANNYQDGAVSVFKGFNSFNGTFYGNGYAIKNYCVQAPVFTENENYHDTGKTDGVSFFGAVGANSIIQDLEMINFNIRPGNNAGTAQNVATASFISRNFAGTLKNVIIEATKHGTDYRFNGSEWGYDAQGFLFFNTEDTAYLESVIVMPHFDASRYGEIRVVTELGCYKFNGLTVIEDKKGLQLGGTQSAESRLQVMISNAEVPDTLTWLQNDRGVYPANVFNFNGLTEGSISSLYDGFACESALTDLSVPDKINFNGKTSIMNIGKTITFTATTNSDKNVVWASTNETVATVDNGVVTGISEGATTISVTVGTTTLSCEVVVLSASTATVLTTKEQFEALNGQDVTGNFILGNDIDFGGITGTDAANNYQDGVASVFQGFNSFDGNFYGNGYALKNFSLQAPEWVANFNHNDTGKTTGASFFGAVSANSLICDVEMIDFNIRPGSNAAVTCNTATASFLSKNFAGTLKNVVIQGTSYGSNYHYNGSAWVMGEMGLLFYSTEATAAIENVVFETHISDRGTQRAVTITGEYTIHNFVMVGATNDAVCGGFGGTMNASSTNATYSNYVDLAANLAYLGGFDGNVFDYKSIDGTNYPTLIDAIDAMVFFAEE